MVQATIHSRNPIHQAGLDPEIEAYEGSLSCNPDPREGKPYARDHDAFEKPVADDSTRSRLVRMRPHYFFRFYYSSHNTVSPRYTVDCARVLSKQRRTNAFALQEGEGFMLSNIDAQKGTIGVAWTTDCI